MADFSPFAISLGRLGIKALERFSKASVHVHGTENIPDGVTIFAVNHFTRLETLLLFSEFHRLTGKPVMSLAHHGLFTGVLGAVLEKVGAVSTKDPNRYKIIIRSLLTGDHSWLIFPEGAMVKDKKIIENGELLINGAEGTQRPPQTGAAALALRAEFYRQRIRHLQHTDAALLRQQLDFFDLTSIEQVCEQETFLVPVNVSYYPIRSRQNGFEKLASYLVKDLPERALEELRTEGTMLLSGVDMDISFGKPLDVKQWLEKPSIREDIVTPNRISPKQVLPSRPLMRRIAKELTKEVMTSIYRNTMVNYDHLAGYILKYYPGQCLSFSDLAERVYLAAEMASQMKSIRFHPALHQDRNGHFWGQFQHKLADFLQTAQKSGVVEIVGDTIHKKKLKTIKSFNFHTIRSENPFQVILNEVEFLRPLTRRLRRIAWYPRWLNQLRLKGHSSRLSQLKFATDNNGLKRVESSVSPRFRVLPKLSDLNGTFKLAHLSDLHLTSPNDFRVQELLNKRAYGYLSWRLRRRAEHGSEVLEALLRDLEFIKPDHIVITGDLTHLSLPREFQEVEQWLQSLGAPSQVTIIPGNHDAYVNTAWDQTFALWKDYMASDAAHLDNGSDANLQTTFPSLRVRGKTALIGVSSARPTAPFLAVGTIGQAQLHKLEKILEETGRQGLFRVVLIHHPPGPNTVSWRKRLLDGEAFRSVLARYGAELVLHGHAHRSAMSELETVAGSLPSIGVPSASSLGRNPWRRARYHIYQLSRDGNGWRVELSERGYSVSEDRFIADGEKQLTLPRPV
ncbi:MAG: metallophosphoesterase [Deltaproteobacteria bacterium]|nr:MAG: metallophosphoesterase [Deltaproteobacteria bacterium]